MCPCNASARELAGKQNIFNPQKYGFFANQFGRLLLLFGIIVFVVVIPTMSSPANSWFPSDASGTRQIVSFPVQIMMLCTV